MEFNETRPFGIEIEACGVERDRLARELSAQGFPTQNQGYGHTDVDYWKIVPDSSVHGRYPFELVSPKLYGQEGLREVKRVMRIVRDLGGSVNTSCGMHVHHSAQGLAPKQARMVSHFYSALYEAFRGIFSLSRCHNIFASVADAQAIHRMRDSDMRYQGRDAVNLTAIFRHGTIEFRQHQGSLNGTKATAWIVFTQQFMLGALRSKKAVSWRKKNLRVGLFNFWGLYDKGETIDEPCEAMLRFMGKRVTPKWQVGRLINARRETAARAEGFESGADFAEAMTISVVIDEARQPFSFPNIFPIDYSGEALVRRHLGNCIVDGGTGCDCDACVTSFAARLQSVGSAAVEV